MNRFLTLGLTIGTLTLGNVGTAAAAPPAPWKLQGDGYIFLVGASDEQNLKDAGISSELASRYQNGVNVLMYVQYHDSPVGPYNELLYIPGQFSLKDGSPERSITKIFVDSEASLAGGQANWGIPKELAQFESNGDEVNVTVDGQTATRFKVESFGPAFPVSTAFIPENLRTLNQLWDGKIFSFALSGTGRVKLASLEVGESNASLFPDLSKRRILAGVFIKDFTLDFPVAEIVTRYGAVTSR